MPASTAKRPRRHAKQERSRATVEALLEAAARVLAAKGYAGATTNRIAATAGASVGTLYEYFANKEAVFDALIQQEIARLVAAIEAEAIDPDAPLGATLRRVLGVAMSAMRHGPDLVRALEQVPGAVFRRRLVVARRSVVALTRRLLEVRRHELRVDDLDLAAFLVVSTAEGIGVNASREQFGDRLAGEVATLLTFYLTGSDGGGRRPPRRKGAARSPGG